MTAHYVKVRRRYIPNPDTLEYPWHAACLTCGQHSGWHPMRSVAEAWKGTHLLRTNHHPVTHYGPEDAA